MDYTDSQIGSPRRLFDLANLAMLEGLSGSMGPSI